jgi:hypothetical protein
VEGIIGSPMNLPDPEDMQRVSYNPYKGSTFTIPVTQTPVHGGRYLIGKVVDSTPTLFVL